jgi:hypothetical protein
MLAAHKGLPGQIQACLQEYSKRCVLAAERCTRIHGAGADPAVVCSCFYPCSMLSCALCACLHSVHPCMVDGHAPAASPAAVRYLRPRLPWLQVGCTDRCSADTPATDAAGHLLLPDDCRMVHRELPPDPMVVKGAQTLLTRLQQAAARLDQNWRRSLHKCAGALTAAGAAAVAYAVCRR